MDRVGGGNCGGGLLMVRNGGSQARSYGEISWPKGAAHLNGTEGTLVKFIKKESRWSVRTDDNTIVNAKPENLIL